MTMMLTRLESDMAGHCWFDMADANTLVLALIEVKFEVNYIIVVSIVKKYNFIYFEHGRVQL